MLAHASIVLLVLGVFVLALRFLLTVEHGKLFLELVVLHTKLATDGNETAQAVNVILVLLVDLFVDLKGLIEEVHASVA